MDTTDSTSSDRTPGEVPASTGGVVDLERIIGNIPVVLVFLSEPTSPTGSEVLRSLGERLVDFGHDRVQVLAVGPVDQQTAVIADEGSSGNARILADPDGSLASRFDGSYDPSGVVTVLVDADGRVTERWFDQADGTIADSLLERLSGLTTT